MYQIIIKWLVLTAAIIVTSYLTRGIAVDGISTAFFAAAVLGILNVFLRPIALVLTLPINIVSLGLFTFVINAFMLILTSKLIPGFHVKGFFAAIIGSLFISFVSWIINLFAEEKVTIINKKTHVETRVKNNTDSEYIDLNDKGDGKWE
ncbi:MAG: phage holin family protein [Proteobacteria bacterium]|nr:phage holin family protein [Pseudomonadota bacterium]